MIANLNIAKQKKPDIFYKVFLLLQEIIDKDMNFRVKDMVLNNII